MYNIIYPRESRFEPSRLWKWRTAVSCPMVNISEFRSCETQVLLLSMKPTTRHPQAIENPVLRLRRRPGCPARWTTMSYIRCIVKRKKSGESSGCSEAPGILQQRWVYCTGRVKDKIARLSALSFGTKVVTGQRGSVSAVLLIRDVRHTISADNGKCISVD